MSESRGDRRGWVGFLRVVTIGLAIEFVGGAVHAHQDSNKPTPPAPGQSEMSRDTDGEQAMKDEPAATPAKSGAGESRELLKALRDLNGAVRKDAADSKRQAAKTPMPKRPARTVTPPTLTPAQLDAMLARFLREKSPKVEPAPPTSDVEFVRRIHLDLAGSPPTPEQVAVFVNDRAKDKRAKLIDALLESPGMAQNWARYWRDTIRFHATNQNPGQVRYDLLEEWLEAQFRKNRPWDEIVTAMITATGRVDENGAVAFSLASEAKPVEMAGEVSRLFLGVQIQCAECHDHKTDSWKRQQFHELAAFFSGTRARNVERGMAGQLPVFSVEAVPRARYAMPDLADPKKQIPVAPRFFLASSTKEVSSLPETLDAPGRRVLGASYITGQDNPWFARAFVNRIWFVLMGDSFYDLVDDIGPERTPKAKEVVETLADQWQKGGYDVRWLLRTITNTEAYQRRVRSTANPAGKASFAAACPSRLRPDQIADSLVQALGLPEDLRPAPLPADGKKGKAAKGADGKTPVAKVKNPAQLAQATGLGGAPIQGKGANKQVRAGGPRALFGALFAMDPSASPDEILGTIPQALFLMNGPLVQARTQARPGTVLAEILASSSSDREALNRLYLRTLSRQPNAKEVETCSAYIGRVGNRAEAFEDINWALVNSTEFISRR
ncbi:DUF1549 domain-containing protein [Aquisphaera insulae]|uniref:DUF1549 domain-containing protein n=1 Tax=Aquisphaera insulae TaxID=2712864 RepID=UPI0013ED79B0|nr:DUF1549 domain-containing protein [Aquisphaera insulae]